MTNSDVAYYIPTYQRVGLTKNGVEKQKTWNHLSSAIREQAVLVCSAEEAPEHEKLGYRTLVCPVQGQLTRVRQWLLETTKADVMFLLDDDLQFYCRASLEDYRHHNATNEEVTVGFQHLEKMVRQGYVMVGLGDRPGNNRNNDERDKRSPCFPVNFFSRPHEVFVFSVPALRRCGFRFRPPVMSDFDMILQILQQGYSVPSTTDFFCGQVVSGKGAAGSNAPGGCSVYRTTDMMRNTVMQLQKEFGRSVVHGRIKTAQWGEISERLDAYIRWKSLWEASSVKHGDLSDPLYQRLLSGYPLVRKSLLGTGPEICLVEKIRSGKITQRHFTADQWRLAGIRIWGESVSDPKVLWRYSCL